MNGLWATRVKMGFGVLLGALLVLGGCSGEDQPPPKGKNKVVVAIVQPASESVEAQPIEKPLKEQKAVTPEVPSAEERTAEKVQPQKTIAEAQEEKETKGVMASSITVKEGIPITTEDEPSAPKDVAVSGSAGSSDTAAASREKKLPELEKGIARVGEGETLSAFAAREDTCGDPLKWTKLYRLNFPRLAMLRSWKEINGKILQMGMALRYLSPVKKNQLQNPFEAKPWVVTVISRQSPGRLAAPAIKLIEGGFRVYITKAEVKGKEWLRLRVGFYPNKSQALAAKKKIGEILGNNDSWIARAGESELEEFGK